MMKEILDKDLYTNNFSRIFVLAVDSFIHPQVITDILSKSSLVKDMELGNYSELTNNSPLQLFKYYFNTPVFEDNSLYDFNDAYWCGYIYMNIFYKYNKPFSYIFLKLPLSKLLDMYHVYHEMDITSVYEVFEELMLKDTILSLLLIKHSYKLSELSSLTDISINVLKKYKNSDINLYAGSFKNIHRIAIVLNEPDNLFLENV